MGLIRVEAAQIAGGLGGGGPVGGTNCARFSLSRPFSHLFCDVSGFSVDLRWWSGCFAFPNGAKHTYGLSGQALAAGEGVRERGVQGRARGGPGHGFRGISVRPGQGGSGGAG